MPEPHIYDKCPAVLELQPGRYSWCTCGLSKTQPFCDHAHREEGVFRSHKFEVTEVSKCALCNCKHTATPPFCDGKHKSL